MLQQADFFVELGHLAFHDPLNHRRRLARRGCLCTEDGLLALQVLGGHVFRLHIARIAGSDVHRNVLQQLLEVVGARHKVGLAIDLDQHANLSARVDVHAGGKIGVLIEVNCESDFVARTDSFQELLKDIAMHIAASDPRYVKPEDVTAEDLEREKEIFRAQAAATGKPAPVIERIVEGKMAKFYEEVCLLEQPFIKDQAVSIKELIATKVGKLGENITVRRFARFKVGAPDWTVATTAAVEAAE